MYHILYIMYITYIIYMAIAIIYMAIAIPQSIIHHIYALRARESPTRYA